MKHCLCVNVVKCNLELVTHSDDGNAGGSLPGQYPSLANGHGTFCLRQVSGHSSGLNMNDIRRLESFN